ncbi:MAG: PD-(D/E)XK nuclease family transposase [bacterium]
MNHHLVIHFLEVPKLHDNSMQTKIEKWLFYLKHEGKEEAQMKVLLKDSDINKAHKVYKHFTEDERLRELYEARMKYNRAQS